MLGRNNADFITVKDVPADKFIEAFAEHLKKTQKVNTTYGIPVDKVFP